MAFCSTHDAVIFAVRSGPHLALRRDRAGDRDGAAKLYQEAADRGVTATLQRLAEQRDRAGNRDGAERLARQAAERGDTAALEQLAWSRDLAGDRDGAEQLRRFGLTDDGNPAHPLFMPSSTGSSA